MQSELGAILNAAPIKMVDAAAFVEFALSVHSLMHMLQTLEAANGFERMCGSHVARLLNKLLGAYRDGFVEYCLTKGILQTGVDRTYTLPELTAWLQVKSRAKWIASRAVELYQKEEKGAKEQRPSSHNKNKSATVLYNPDQTTEHSESSPKSKKKSSAPQERKVSKGKEKPKP